MRKGQGGLRGESGCHARPHGLALLQALMQKARAPNEWAETGGGRDTSAACQADLEGLGGVLAAGCVSTVPID